ncbi:unnamed protein product [Zymoseptoria tritici ST99CH_3D7]|uniref:Chitin-binding type-2 domain-containing protein n=1 Tax=Zymoseptoria tritici (strain ST99CH_3D7) TaxID=1276538 RepID=A0A1X7RVJ0_ZYMT9|nr:unnamed protein product [Zymoseptoria tritici ST99CH_3D7]
MKLFICAMLAASVVARAPYSPCTHGGEWAACPYWRCCHPFVCADDKHCHLMCEWGGQGCPPGLSCQVAPWNKDDRECV